MLGGAEMMQKTETRQTGFRTNFICSARQFNKRFWPSNFVGGILATWPSIPRRVRCAGDRGSLGISWRDSA